MFLNIGILILSFQTLECWSYFNKLWNFDLIVPNVVILAPFVKALELLSYPCKHWNSIFIHIKILALFLWTLEFWSYSSKHCNSDLILLKGGILGLFFYTLAFWSYPSKHGICGQIIKIGIRILFFQLFEFRCCFYKHWNSDLILQNIWILVLFL